MQCRCILQEIEQRSGGIVRPFVAIDESERSGIRVDDAVVAIEHEYGIDHFVEHRVAGDRDDLQETAPQAVGVHEARDAE